MVFRLKTSGNNRWIRRDNEIMVNSSDKMRSVLRHVQIMMPWSITSSSLLLLTEKDSILVRSNRRERKCDNHFESTRKVCFSLDCWLTFCSTSRFNNPIHHTSLRRIEQISLPNRDRIRLVAKHPQSWSFSSCNLSSLGQLRMLIIPLASFIHLSFLPCIPSMVSDSFLFLSFPSASCDPITYYSISRHYIEVFFGRCHATVERRNHDDCRTIFAIEHRSFFCLNKDSGKLEPGGLNWSIVHHFDNKLSLKRDMKLRYYSLRWTKVIRRNSWELVQ